MLLSTGLINTTNNFDFRLNKIKPERGLKLMVIYGYNISEKGGEVI